MAAADDDDDGGGGGGSAVAVVQRWLCQALGRPPWFGAQAAD
jgi:hypothetical protein